MLLPFSPHVATQLALLSVSLISDAIDTATSSNQLRGLVTQAPASPPQIHKAMSAKVSKGSGTEQTGRASF